ncbi:ATP-grasp domain-containing protein [Pseudomonas sp. JH-2]|uniref:ATP-grasp domain-containing protein n=1 Tax=Pseudomonas sp. JH-2 TaxID=3114998 RepID=UPI002E252F19|nr:ATP-grasp domain-containing protein [Pseudomonas sp. JH-2]
MTKRFLVLGIGAAQADLLARLTSEFETHALSNTTAGPGRAHARHFAQVDITDRDSVLRYARDHAVDQIYSVGSDVAMPTVGYVAEQLHLPRLVSEEVAVTCNNKGLLRHHLQGLPGSLEFEVLEHANQVTSVPLPAMLKPVDSQGQRGVCSVSAYAQIPAAFAAAVGFSRSGRVIVEQKIEGREISVNAFFAEGEMVFFLPSERESWAQFDGGIIRRHILPASFSDRAEEAVRELVLRTAAQLGIQEGPLYFQIKMNGDLPYLIEVAPRLDGCHLWRLILASTGVDLLDGCIKRLQGRTVTMPAALNVRPAYLEFFCQPPGESFSLVDAHPDAVHVEFYYAPGEYVRSTNGVMEKCGYQIVMGEL